MFTPETVALPDVWPACRRSRCGSESAVARVEAPYGPIVVECENGHFRRYQKKDDFRRGRRYAGLFSDEAVGVDAPRTMPAKLLEIPERRRAEVLEDAERCALCGTPPAEHRYRPDLDVRGDREIWGWLQRWRPALYAELVEAVAIAGRRERLTFADWRSKIPARLREAIVGELAGSSLEADHLVPLARLAACAGVLGRGELHFAVHRLLLPICRACNGGRWRAGKRGDEYLREYVLAVHGGDDRLARADAAQWRTMEAVAFAAARVRLATDERSA